MLESIYVGMTGLMGYSRGLRVIANNAANLNTPGFKSSSLQFADMFYSNGSLAAGSGPDRGQIGYGLNTYATNLNFSQGELRQTGNTLDLAIDGQGLFALEDDSGDVRYTRSGQFEFNADGVLVNRADGAKVMALGTDGTFTEISTTNERTHPAKATTTVTFNGNLSSTATEQTVSGVRVLDAVGGEHLLSVKFTKSTTTSGVWTLEVLDGSETLASGSITFSDGLPTADTAKLSFTYTPSGQAAMPLTFDFGSDVTSYASGDLSTLAAASQDGYEAGALSSVSFDTSGYMVLAYTNGQTVKSSRLALGRFDSLDAVTPSGDNQFTVVNDSAWHTGFAGENSFGGIRSGVLEISNVDLSQEFSDLVIMQRGYQASSQIVATANDMLQELFNMKGK